MHPANGNGNNLSSQNLWKSSKNMSSSSVNPKNNDHNAYINKSNWNFPSRITVEICMTRCVCVFFFISSSRTQYIVPVCCTTIFFVPRFSPRILFAFFSFGRGYFSIKFFPVVFSLIRLFWFTASEYLQQKKKIGAKPKMFITLRRLSTEYAIRLNKK